MTNQQGAPEALRPIARYKIGYATDGWGMRSSTPSGIPHHAGAWVRYEDHVAALVEAQQPAPSAAAALSVSDGQRALHEAILNRLSHAELLEKAHYLMELNSNQARTIGELQDLVEAAPQPSPTPQADSQPAPIDMVLHCPKCGLQHIDTPEKVDRRLAVIDPPAAWAMDPWNNPPHRSHLCHSCGHIWRPADVPTNGVAAVKTTGKADSPIAARAPADSVTAPAGGGVAGPTSAHIAAMERAWLWMENQADSQSKGGHATFDLLMLREERDALRAAIDMEVTATCPYCNGTGEVFGHAQNCTDDLCALNGDEHSCAGQVEHCQCAAAPTPSTAPLMRGFLFLETDMKTPKGQIDRTGVVNFGDASVSVWEEGISAARNADGYAGEKAWCLAFKRQVFARIVQTLHRIGWTVAPWEDAERYKAIAANHRTCSKGELKGELDVSGRSITFKMWQGVNTPTRSDHGGRYESNLEACMPYVLRLEMERTRRRIRDYLCNVFSGYTFDSKSRSIYRKPLEKTAMERIEERYAESCHFKGDMAAYLKCNGYQDLPSYNRTSSDGKLLEHGQRVWTTDWHGRWIEGTALYNINSMWWVVTGRYDYTNKSASELRTTPPENPRVKQNQRQRRKRLEGLIADAVKVMDFDRAKVLKAILWPQPEPLFHIIKNGAYFGPNYCGYTTSLVDAGKYAKDELRPYADQIKRGTLRAVPVAA